MGEADHIGLQGPINGLGDAEAAADQGCKVQNMTLQLRHDNGSKFPLQLVLPQLALFFFFWICARGTVIWVCS